VSPAPSAAALVIQVRLWSGLVLFVYLTTHFLNHALGLVSLEAMNAGREWFVGLWRSVPGTVALYASFATHNLLALWALYRKRTLRMPAWEAAQLTLGLLVPPLLVWHVVGTRLAHEVAGTQDTYTTVVLVLSQLDPVAGLRQVVVLVVAWVHGCIGIHFWLRLRPWYPRVARALYSGFLLVPVLALLGFAAAAQDVGRLAREQPAFLAGAVEAARFPDPERRAALRRVAHTIFWGDLAAIGLVLVARAVREHVRRRQGVRVGYPGGREVVVPLGFTVLEASRYAGIPHASVCGGRGRCSTCRVRVLRGGEHLPSATTDELRVLGRVGAPSHVRLACQVRPRRDLAVAPLVPAGAGPRDAQSADRRDGEELTIAVLFADLRGFTRLAERKLPYDVVFILNRYFEAVGGAITDAGGIVNQFTGDGVMALFGVDGGPVAGCRQAIRGAAAMVARVQELSRALAEDLATPLRLGIGIHTGPTVVGRMGYGTTTYLTAVGDTVHVAARLEALTKDYGCELLLSEEVAAGAGLDLSDHARHELTVRNREAPLAVFVVPSAQRLAERLAPEGGRVIASREG
jgi:adenylate cyclase